MGKSYQGILGNYSGKVGNVVGRVRQGRTIVGVYQPIVNQPNTTAQVNQKNLFGDIIKLLAPLAPVVKETMRNVIRYGSAWNALVKVNLPEAVTGDFPNKTLDYEKVIVSVGTLDLPFNTQGSVDGSTLNVAWTDNSGLGNATADDASVLIALNTNKSQVIYNLEASKRSDRTATLTFPAAWNGDNVEVYFAMHSPDNKDYSKSQHIGSYSL